MGISLKKDTIEDLRKSDALHECKVCQNHHTMNCPNSSLCYATKEKPYYKSWVHYLIMYLKERHKI